MNETKHSPTPWRVCANRDFIAGPDNKPIRTMHFMHARPNAALAVTCVNACAALNPDDPARAAAAIHELYLAARDTLYIDEPGGFSSMGKALERLDEAIATVARKEPTR